MAIAKPAHCKRSRVRSKAIAFNVLPEAYEEYQQVKAYYQARGLPVGSWLEGKIRLEAQRIHREAQRKGTV